MRQHLVLVHTPKAQAVEDWHEIAGHVREFADDIEVFVVNNDDPDHEQRARIAEHPTLVFSPSPLKRFEPPRGKIYQGCPIPKFEQLQRLAEGRVPVPPTAILQPGMTLDPAFWGEIVLLKPAALLHSSHGKGVTLAPTRKVRYRPPEEYPEGHPGRDGPMLVQGFVDSGPQRPEIRVLTLFGEPLYAHEKRARLEAYDLGLLRRMPGLAALQSLPVHLIEYDFIRDERVFRLARKAYRAMPEFALQALDIVRQVSTGRLYVLEANLGGNTWHFSSQFAQSYARVDPKIGEKRRDQFEAFRTAAKLLVERTQREAE